MKNIVKLVILSVLIVLVGTIFIYGLPLSNYFGYYDIKPIKDDLKYGLDLTGGMYVVLEAKEEKGQKISETTLDKAVSTIRNRIDAMGVKEPTITKQGTNRIRVSIPDIKDQQAALKVIGTTAKLEFVSPKGEVLLSGADVKKASYEIQKSDLGVESPVVSLEFSSEGAKKFANATSKYINQVITIKLDNEVISAPTVQQTISNGKAVITGSKDKEEAINLATLINAGSLPVELKPIEVRAIGPTLGQDSLNKAVKAGVIGVLLVFVFMIIVYRLPGIVSTLALSIYILLYLIILTALGVTLTLPGIAGIILSVGMAVDANVIIFARLKEELNIGKSLLAAIDTAFSRAFSTILDSNITTMIAGLVLFFFGSGTIKGFAVTLMLGIVISMFTAIFITKSIMKTTARIDGLDKPKYYGLKEAAHE